MASLANQGLGNSGELHLVLLASFTCSIFKPSLTFALRFAPTALCADHDPPPPPLPPTLPAPKHLNLCHALWEAFLGSLPQHMALCGKTMHGNMMQPDCPRTQKLEPKPLSRLSHPIPGIAAVKAGEMSIAFLDVLCALFCKTLVC